MLSEPRRVGLQLLPACTCLSQHDPLLLLLISMRLQFPAAQASQSMRAQCFTVDPAVQLQEYNLPAHHEITRDAALRHIKKHYWQEHTS